MKAAAERGLRYSYCITSGNEPDLGLADYLNFVIDDPATRQVVLFIEGIRRPEAFMHAAGRALAMGKPILAIKTGATAQSQAASQSHTGAIRQPPNSRRRRSPRNDDHGRRRPPGPDIRRHLEHSRERFLVGPYHQSGGVPVFAGGREIVDGLQFMSERQHLSQPGSQYRFPVKRGTADDDQASSGGERQSSAFGRQRRSLRLCHGISQLLSH